MALLVLPGFAIQRSGVHWLFAAGYFVAITGITYALYASDKERAVKSEWRISESMLHLAEALGGWPGAYIAQRRLRHKCSKGSYMATFWVIVLLHQVIALDFLMGWVLVRKVAILLGSVF